MRVAARWGLGACRALPLASWFAIACFVVRYSHVAGRRPCGRVVVTSCACAHPSHTQCLSGLRLAA
eukprot:7188068-Prymnesium_polylepis.1